jgi:D-threo-aldose 1-dehydrogenase
MNDLPLGTREVGHTGLHVSRLGLGTATLGNLYERVSDQDASAVLAAAIDQGMTYVDTAPYYGFGLSERRVGNALRERRDIVVSTKVGRLLSPDVAGAARAERHDFKSSVPFSPVYDYTYSGVLRSYEDSLQRLGMARIDILYVHDIGVSTHGSDDALHFEALTRGGGLRALDELRTSGVIRAFGVGVNEIEACHRVMDHAALDVILLAGRYTLLEQGAVSTLLPRCERAGTSVVIGGPYSSGILATGVKQGGALHYNYREPAAHIVRRVEAIEDLCDRFGVPLAAAALQFPLAHSAVISVIPGLGHPRHIAETVSLCQIEITGDLWIALRSAGLIDEAAPVPGAVIVE